MIAMKRIHIPVFRGLLLLVLFSPQLYVAHGKESAHVVRIPRNLAWNDLMSQIKSLQNNSSQDSLDNELLIIQQFLKAHETEMNVGFYDIAVFRALDQARSRLQKADKDLETFRNELSYKEEQAKLGR